MVNEVFFKQRTKFYLHFDKKRTPSHILRYVIESKNICKHAFYPFIAYTQTDTKIHKPNGLIEYKYKNRPISYPSHIDGAIYAYYAHLLEQPYENWLTNNGLQDNITAFRKIKGIHNGKQVAKNNIYFSKDVFDTIRARQDCVVLCYDITGFFDNLNHKLLKQAWCEVLNVERLPTDYFKVFHSLTRYAYVDKTKLYQALGLSLNSRTLHKRLQSLCSIEDFHTKVKNNKLIKRNLKPKGIPQGSPISGILSNIYMTSFDKQLTQQLGQAGHYFRYCDDMLIITDKAHEQAISAFLEKAIKQLKLTINDRKTQRVEFIHGQVAIDPKHINSNNPAKLQYLGLTFDGQSVFLRDAGLSKYHRKMRLAVRMHRKRFENLQRKGLIQNDRMYRKALNQRFSYIGKNNYLSYVFRVARVHDSDSVKRQVSGHWGRMSQYLGNI